MAFAALPLAAMAAEAATPALVSGLGSLGLSSGVAEALAPIVASKGLSVGKKLIKPLGNKLFGHGRKKKHSRGLIGRAARTATKAAKKAAKLTQNPLVGELARAAGVPESAIETAQKGADIAGAVMAHKGTTDRIRALGTGISDEVSMMGDAPGSEIAQIGKFAEEAMKFHDMLSAFNQPSGDQKPSFL